MNRFYHYQSQLQATILQNKIEAYKQQRVNWLNDPQIKQNILLNALLSWPSIAIITFNIAIGGVLFIVLNPPLYLGVLIAIGVVTVALMAEIIFIYFSFKSKIYHEIALRWLLNQTQSFNLDDIRNKNLVVRLYKALEYWALIAEAIETVPPGMLHNNLLNTNYKVTHWLQTIYLLANRIDQFRLNLAFWHDLEEIPLVIEQNQYALQHESNPQSRQYLQQIISHRQQQLQTLYTLQNQHQEALYQLDNTISALGAIYSQLLLICSQRQNNTNFKHLQEEISEQVHRLEDTVMVMTEVYK